MRTREERNVQDLNWSSGPGALLGVENTGRAGRVLVLTCQETSMDVVVRRLSMSGVVIRRTPAAVIPAACPVEREGPPSLQCEVRLGGVTEIVVLGHSLCGCMGYRRAPCPKSATGMARMVLGAQEARRRLGLAMAHVRSQLERLAAEMGLWAAGRDGPALSGYLFLDDSGLFLRFDSGSGSFKPATEDLVQ